jgi:hypothetical protein
MFGNLSSSLQGLQGFGDLDAPAAKASSPAPAAPAIPVAQDVHAVSAVTAQDPAPAAIGASLQEIDPELGSSYDALLRELGSAPRLK